MLEDGRHQKTQWWARENHRSSSAKRGQSASDAPTMPPFKKAMSIPPGHWKSTTDAFNGYHSVAIRESDRPLTTFLTPWGRYRYRTTPQGYKISGDAYTHRFDKITVDVQDCDRVIDDTILHKPTVGEIFQHVAEYLTLCGRNGISQNLDNFTFCEKTVDWVGFRLVPDGVRPLPSHADAIRSFPTSRNVTDVRSFMALVNQVSAFHATQPQLLPFRELLKKDTPFYWDQTLDRFFNETKIHIASEIEKGIMTLNLTKPTCLLTDWSKTGLGYIMLQKHCSCSDHSPTCCASGWKVCGVGSRITSPAESRYSPSEGEALAVVNALEKNKYFTLGCNNLTIGTDHKSLLGLFKDRSLDGIDNPRLRRLKEKTFGWSFTMLHIPGRLHGGPDALSRYGLQPVGADAQLENDSSERHHLTALMATPPTPDDIADAGLLMTVSSTLQPIDLFTVANASKEDATVRAVVHMVNTTFPASPDELDPAVREFWRIRRDLSTAGHVLLYKGRLVRLLCLHLAPLRRLSPRPRRRLHTTPEGRPDATAVDSAGALFKPPTIVPDDYSVSATALNPSGEDCDIPLRDYVISYICEQGLFIFTYCYRTCDHPCLPFRRSLHCIHVSIGTLAATATIYGLPSSGRGHSWRSQSKALHLYSRCPWQPRCFH